jgi:hypothetical protein
VWGFRVWHKLGCVAGGITGENVRILSSMGKLIRCIDRLICHYDGILPVSTLIRGWGVVLTTFMTDLNVIALPVAEGTSAIIAIRCVNRKWGYENHGRKD